jgi:flagellar biosynthesis chaperone FliJ
MSELQKLEKLKKQQEEEAKNTNKNLVKERTEMDDLAVLMSLSGQKKP